VYEGFSTFIELLHELVRRPSRGETPQKQLGGDRWGLPLLCLVRDDEAKDVLTEVRKYLRRARPTPVPHAMYEFAEDTPGTSDPPVSYTDLNHVAEALFSLAKDLSAGTHKAYGRIRFPRFELTRWLMLQRLDTDNRVEYEGELARRIRRFELDKGRKTPQTNGVEQALPETVPWWAHLALRVLPPLWFRLRLRFGAQYRWFLRQSFLAPHDPGTFLGFAHRLTGWLLDEEKRTDASESAEELLGLLVNAFLEDVRRAYRRGLWRPGGTRRTAYTVVLLDRITRRNGGYRLLETVNRVRATTGLFDPLLFVSTSRKVPPDAFPPGTTSHTLWPMGEARSAYKAWCSKFSEASRKREAAAWYLPIQCKVTSEKTPWNDPPDDTVVLDPPPWWRAVVIPTALVLVVALVVGPWWWLDQAASRRAAAHAEREQAWREQHCGLDRTAPFANYLVTIDGECIGVSAEPVPIFDSSGEVRDVQNLITRQNGEAERLHRENPQRQLVSVAYISELSAVGSIQPSEIERLQGVAARQRRQLDGSVADPLVRIVFVNAGHDMRHGARAAAMLAQLADQEDPVVGAIGLAVSSQATVQTIRALGEAGIPMVAAPLTADGIERESPLYYQIPPQNRREAQVAARYARQQLNATGPVIVVTSGNPDDLYDATLARDAREEFTREGFTVQEQFYTPSPDLGTPERPMPRMVGQQLCFAGSLVFFTGRPADFEQLLDGVNQTCNSTPPTILAGDDVSRYVANADLRERFPLVPFDYIALAPGDQTCYTGGDLSNTLLALFPDRCARTRDSVLTDDASTAYDALTAVVAAVNRLRGTAVTPGAVWHMLSRITGSNRIDGASGVIDFGRDGSQIPLNKFLAVMRVDGLGPPKVQATCGELRGRTPAVWCP
jgi:ABC-type branched-subunit amino acid transport system substrate-binding protein